MLVFVDLVMWSVGWDPPPSHSLALDRRGSILSPPLFQPMDGMEECTDVIGLVILIFINFFFHSGRRIFFFFVLSFTLFLLLLNTKGFRIKGFSVVGSQGSLRGSYEGRCGGWGWRAWLMTHLRQARSWKKSVKIRFATGAMDALTFFFHFFGSPAKASSS